MKKNILFLSFWIIAAMAFAQQDQASTRKRDGHRGDPKARMAEKLELTDEQKAKIEDLRLEHMKATSCVKSQLKIKKAELDAAVTAENPDRKAVDRLIKEIGDMQNQLLKEKIYHRIEVRSILDDKQKLRFDQMQHHMMEGPRKGKRG